MNLCEVKPVIFARGYFQNTHLSIWANTQNVSDFNYMPIFKVCRFLLFHWSWVCHMTVKKLSCFISNKRPFSTKKTLRGNFSKLYWVSFKSFCLSIIFGSEYFLQSCCFQFSLLKFVCNKTLSDWNLEKQYLLFFAYVMQYIFLYTYQSFTLIFLDRYLHSTTFFYQAKAEIESKTCIKLREATGSQYHIRLMSGTGWVNWDG